MSLPPRRLPVFVAVLLLAAWPAAAARADLASYLARPEPKFAWKLEKKNEEATGTIYDLRLTSQTWEGITWEHRLQVYQPKSVKPSATMLLWNTGGSPSLPNTLFALSVANKIQAPVAILFDIPNQPLFDKKEDALIAETLVRALETKDFDWPLLFPMVKSVLKAMDALQAFAKQEWQTEVKEFIVGGASKRGWTSWLTGASGDKRVRAIVPMVIDTLNMQEQMAHQMEAFGAYSAMIGDYTARKLVPLPPGEDARKLWKMIDPYSYRDQITMPKLLVFGNNDPYWTADALNLYWDGLKGDKWITYVPNAGHNLEQPGGDRTRALNALSAFVRAQSTGKELPKMRWMSDTTRQGRVEILLESTPAPLATRVWSAEAPTQDFRKAVWKESATSKTEQGVVGGVALPKEGWKVFYVEADYELDGIRYTLCTQVRVVQAK
jgi:PhoPQ-activated pathogenicity-related protein